jgi:endonuclease/exonuclease/phosphatase family metal-dependent hydrolase
MAIIRDRLGHEGVSASSLVAEDGEYGQMLLCRWPLTDVAIHDLSVKRFEPRRAIAATAVTPGGNLRVIATHLGLRFGERREQVGKLSAALAGDLPTVLLGDFNDWIRYRSVQATLEETFPDYTRNRTYPARVPLLALDRIFCRPADCFPITCR